MKVQGLRDMVDGAGGVVQGESVDTRRTTMTEGSALTT